jgi:hypothetical protein
MWFVAAFHPLQTLGEFVSSLGSEGSNDVDVDDHGLSCRNILHYQGRPRSAAKAICVWSALGFLCAAGLILTPVQTHAVKLDFPPADSR